MIDTVATVNMRAVAYFGRKSENVATFSECPKNDLSDHQDFVRSVLTQRVVTFPNSNSPYRPSFARI